MNLPEEKRYTILLIEDDRDQIQFVRTILRPGEGAVGEIHAEETLTAGLETLRALQPDLLLLDLHLPDSAGLETFRKAKDAADDIPVIIFSGNRDEQLAVEAVRLGAQDYLLKGDLREPLFSRSLQYAVERKRIMRELDAAHTDLERQNAALEQARRELQTERDMFVAGPTVVFRRGAADGFPIDFVSQNVSRFGYRPAELTAASTPFETLVHEDDRARFRREMDERRESGGDVLEIEYRIHDAHGEIVWLHEITRFLRDADGRVTAQQAYVVDITGRRRAESSLALTQRRYETLLGNIDDVIYEVDPEGRFRYVSPVIRGILGYEPGELTGEHCASFIPPDRREEWKEQFPGMLEGKISTAEFPFLTRGGEERTLRFTSRRQMIGDTLQGIAGVISDTTDQRRMEETLRDIRNQTQQYLDIAEVAILSLGLDGRILTINKKGATILGYAERDLIGRNWFDVCIPEEQREAMRDFFERIVRGEETQPDIHENPVLTAAGEERQLRWHNALLNDARGRVTGVLSSGEDVTEQRRIEEEVRGSRELIELALWGADLGAWEWYLRSDALLLNQRSAEMFGYSLDDPPLYAAFREQTLPEEDIPRVKELLDRHLAGETPFYQNENWVITASGEWKWILERGKVVEYDSMGSPVRVAGTFLDLTERKYAEIALEDSEKKFRLLAEHSTDIIWTADAEFKLTFVSPSAKHILGYAPEELIGTDFTEIVHESGKSSLLEELHARIHGSGIEEQHERGLRLEIQVRKKNGDPLWVEIVATPVVDSSGRLLTIHGNTRDIHRRKTALIALSDSEEKYRLLVENQTDLVVRVDTEGHFLFVSPSYCRMFGKSEEELLGAEFYPMVHEDDRASTLRAMKSLFEPPHTAHIEQRALTADGWRWLAWSDTAELDGNGEISAIIGVGRDITERKMAELALIESEKRLRTIIINLPVILFSFDAEGIFTLSEGKGLEALSLSPGQVVGQSIFSVYADYPDIIRDIERSLRGDFFVSVIHIADHFFETWFSPLKDERGTVMQVIGVAVDISERIRTDKELHRYRDHLEELVEARTLELERANERLKRFRFALDSAADNIYIVDPKTMKFLDLNDSAVHALGYSREELLTMGPADIQAGSGKEDTLGIYADVRDGRTELGVFETEHRRKDGDIFPAEVFVRSFEISDGTLLVATSRDITRRKQVELALKDSESKYRNVLENANEAIMVLQDNRLKFFNYKVLELTGLAEEDLVGLSILEFVHPEDHDEVRLQYEKRVSGQLLPESYDVRMFDTNGTIKWMEVRDVLIDWEGEPATLNFFNDITARKAAEQYIRFQASLLSIVRNSVVAIDPVGHVTSWNAFAETLYGWTADEVEGKKIFDIPTFGKEFAEVIMPALRAKGAWEGELERVRKDGDRLAVYAMWNAIRHEDKVTGYVGIGIDMTERKKLERELLQSQKLASLGILSEGIAHELRNPLGYASSAAQMLLRKKDMSDELRVKYSTAIHTGVEKANKIVENLLLIGKPKGQLMKKQIDLIEAVEEAFAMLDEQPLLGTVKRSSRFKSKPLFVLGNREMLVQLFFNLFMNALNAMEGSGTLRVEGEQKGERVLVRVSDTGPGIPDDIVDNIFDPFFTTSKTDKGVGLGLTLCYFIMQDHDGKIELDTTVEKGATFELTFRTEQ